MAKKQHWMGLIFLSCVSCASLPVKKHSYSEHQKSTPFSSAAIYHYLAGELSSLSGKEKLAEFHFKKGFKAQIGKKKDFWHWRLTQEYFQQGLSHKALNEGLQLIKLSQNKRLIFSAHLLLARIYTDIQMNQKALRQYQHALNIRPFDKTALLNEAALIALLGKNLPVRSRQILNREPLFHQYMGDIYWMRGFENKAVQSFKKALQQAPSDRVSALRLFQIYGQKNKFDQWTKFMEKQNIEDAYITSLTAQAYLKQDKREKALEKLEDLLWDHPIVQDLRVQLKIENLAANTDLF